MVNNPAQILAGTILNDRERKAELDYVKITGLSSTLNFTNLSKNISQFDNFILLPFDPTDGSSDVQISASYVGYFNYLIKFTDLGNISLLFQTQYIGIVTRNKNTDGFAVAGSQYKSYNQDVKYSVSNKQITINGSTVITTSGNKSYNAYWNIFDANLNLGMVYRSEIYWAIICWDNNT